MKRQTLFLDTEFTGLHQQARLISLALVDNHRSFYAEFNDFPEIDLTDWHQEHVINNLLFKELDTHGDIEGPHWQLKNTTAQVANQLRAFLQNFSKVKVWADVLAYDWVLFCELFGGAMQLPESTFYIPGDMATLIQLKGYDPDTDRASLLDSEQQRRLEARGLRKHNALYDAYLIQAIYHQLT